MLSSLPVSNEEELNVSFSLDDEFDDFDGFDDDFYMGEEEDDEILDEFDEDVSLYDESFSEDDFDDPYDDHEPEDGYVQFHSEGEELTEDDDLRFNDEDF
ncbi:MAG: hypothetical protein MJ162_03045 [Treponema sp.]|nr:hypothetical protein [Treponema sp.]